MESHIVKITYFPYFVIFIINKVAIKLLLTYYLVFITDLGFDTACWIININTLIAETFKQLVDRTMMHVV